MDKFIYTCNLKRENHEELGDINRSMAGKKIESVIKSLPTKKNPGPDGFAREFYQAF